MNNTVVERLYRTLKYVIHLEDYETVDERIKVFKEYFWFYNNERAHQGLEGKAPAEYISRNLN